MQALYQEQGGKEEMTEEELKQQLTAAEEQLAEMREQVAIHSTNAGELAWLLQDIKESWWDKHYPPDIFVGGGHSDASVNEIVRIREAIEQALSAARKRGRVLWTHEAIADWDDYGALRCKHTVIRMPGHGAFPIKDGHITDETGKSVTVTVREEAE